VFDTDDGCNPRAGQVGIAGFSVFRHSPIVITAQIACQEAEMASIPYEYKCDKSSGFIMDPNAHKRVGYVTSFGGLRGTSIAADLIVTVPFNGGTKPPHFADFKYQSTGGTGSASVVGVLEQFSWAGGAGDSIKLDFYVSQTNAVHIKTLQQKTQMTTKISGLSWWIADYDQEHKTWFEQSYPNTGPISGIITGKENPQLNVDLTPVNVKDGIDVNVYKISLAVASGANLSYPLSFANSNLKPVVKSWGVVVGTLASSAYT
jgi:hypothetical protein